MRYVDRLRKKSKGLGDTIEKIAYASGVEWAVNEYEKRTSKKCGCKKRRDKLNKLIPYKNRECKNGN